MIDAEKLARMVLDAGVSSWHARKCPKISEFYQKYAMFISLKAIYFGRI